MRQPLFQRSQSQPCDRTDGYDRRPMQVGRRQQIGDLHLHQLQPLGIVDPIDFGQDYDSPGNPQKIQDGQMLAGLWHHPFVRSNDQHCGVDPADAGQHVFDKIDMSGHIDNSDCLWGELRGQRRELTPGKPEVDRHAARFFFFEPIRVHPRQRPYQRRLAVIYMAGSAENTHLAL